ncbi:ATP-binding cassette domain-containing protein [Clostridium tagluense]|uniref:ribosomal protection-like ABC-F family protein n=1 Tax=Clostridium tagluense TaxID=360422 RepID=UPI001CF320C7|nr:ABC-F family ATP-binding cassette domain-containing protein [Clostridium tagluense]MCB2313828.1 ATP-binding cassette domain-containing protein [Clostridium tagluense]MCB2318622.1 ATP-binding cassette domain-containing protein [Clostridium tagluense]MCB2323497.1 ATP-binding cassette domain-containing protein [Clostridium tagluense]MCB2328366.1 ATP-binding cassette domain-containing protein [Clostridium tagluense]MCB2333242.1 ATP-binding cassette domain-containing protein [Clostridium tagluen
MIELSLRNIEKYYGATRVLEDITFNVKTGQKIGIVGLNGSGKTTLFKVICGTEKYENGKIDIRKNATIGYLEQVPEALEKYKVIDILRSAFEEVLDVRSKIVQLENKMQILQGKSLENAISKYGELQGKFEHMGGYDIDTNIKYVCMGLKIDEDMKERIFNTLSGGEKTTILLGKILLQKADILLLDEPSNHLDIQAIEWLEGYLKEYEGAVLIISHDRYFMDRVVKKIVEIEKGKSTMYHGNYSHYIKDKRNRYNRKLSLYNIQNKKMMTIKNSIDRLRRWEMKGGSGKFYIKAASMQKRLGKIVKMEKPSLENKKINIDFALRDKEVNEVLEVVGLSKSFHNKMLFENLNLKVEYGDRLAIVGRNGTGKSTLAKMLVKECKADEGIIRYGEEVKIGYLAQNVTFTSNEQTVLEAFREDLAISQQKARSALAKFLFTKDDVFKSIGTLSGGERSRLRLCKLMQQDINLLILDEPTNHFDINSREMIEKSLMNFEGTIICISHDRYFINKIAEKVVELTKDGACQYKIKETLEIMEK